jgi:Fe-S oxidoreductase
MSKPAREIIPAGHVYVKDNVLQKSNLTGISENKALWAKDLGLPKKAEYTFFAGCGYQQMKYIEGMMSALKGAGKVGLSIGKVTGISKVFGKVGIDLTTITARVKAAKEDPYTPVLVSSVAVLRKLGVDLGYMHEEEPCCGSPMYYAGFEHDYAKHAQENYRLFKARSVNQLIGLVPGCTSALKNVYPGCVEGYDLQVQHVLAVIAERLKRSTVKPKAREKVKVTYHDPCQLSRYLQIVEEPRNIIKSIRGVELVESDPEQCGRWSTCCGGGGLEATHPDLSERIGMRRAEELVGTGAEVILSNCPACDLQLTRMVKRLDAKIKVMDLIRFLDEALS